MAFLIRKIEADRQEAFLQAMSVPFCNDPSAAWKERFKIALAQAELCATFDGDQIVSTFGSYNLDLTVPGGAQVPMAGTTLVTVLPTHRRQGILTAHMRKHFQEAKENHQPLAALWASESAIYGRFGYGPAAESSKITLEKRYAKLKEPAEMRGSMRLVSVDPALEAFPKIYDPIARRRAGMFPRTTDWWKLRNLADPEELRRGATSQRLVLYERDGDSKGYVIFRTRTDFATYTNDLLVVELIGQDAEAQRALWQFVFGVDLISKIQFWNLPQDDPLLWWLEEPREAWPKPSDSIWVRPVDVADALNRRVYAASGRIVFRFRDGLCPWNEGVYSLEADANGTANCTASGDAAELELTPYTLGAIYLGGHRVRKLASAGLIQGSPEAVALADAMFGWHEEPWCQEIF